MAVDMNSNPIEETQRIISRHFQHLDRMQRILVAVLIAVAVLIGIRMKGDLRNEARLNELEQTIRAFEVSPQSPQK